MPEPTPRQIEHFYRKGRVDALRDVTSILSELADSVDDSATDEYLDGFWTVAHALIHRTGKLIDAEIRASVGR